MLKETNVQVTQLCFISSAGLVCVVFVCWFSLIVVVLRAYAFQAMGLAVILVILQQNVHSVIQYAFC